MSNLQDDNLMNSQWADLFAFEKTQQQVYSSYVQSDACRNFYSTSDAIERKNSIFSDKSEKRQANGVAHFLFDLSNPKKKSTRQGYLSSSSDLYRQGVEIQINEQWSAGFRRISAGTRGHLLDTRIFGLNESISLTDNDFFQELSLFNPLEFIQLQEEDKPIESVITFPIVTSDANQRENSVLNGVIEPFPIRPVIAYFSINFPFEPHGVTANFESGNSYLRTATDAIDSVYDFYPRKINNQVFLDAGERISVTNNEGTNTVEVGPQLPYVTSDTNYLEPFDDFSPSRGDKNLRSKNYDLDFLNIIEKMPEQETTYLTLTQVSGKTGFVYNNTLQGIDSIAYGGLLR